MRKIVKFLNCRINFSKFNVLPREETEFWVKKVAEEIKKEKKKIKILDLFSGTGCIGISVLKSCSEFCKRVDFGDKDDRALKQIEINLKLNKINLKTVKVIKTCIFSKIKGKYDLILANPPYVAEERLDEVEPAVKKNEPKKAWYAGKRGMDYIPEFLKEAKNFLEKTGKIYFEFDPWQKKETEGILKKEKYDYAFLKDQFKRIRYVKICFLLKRDIIKTKVI